MNLADLRDHLDQQTARIDGSGHLPLDAVFRRAVRIRRTRSRPRSPAPPQSSARCRAVGIVPALIRADQPQPIGPPTPAISTSGGQGSPDGLPSGCRRRARTTTSATWPGSAARSQAHVA